MNRTRLPVRGASLFLALLPTVTPAAAANDSMSVARPISAVIEDYVRLGSESSLTLENQRLQAEQSEMALRAAQARLRPEVSINSRYTVNSGGREITVPIDELLNPAYQTLNQLLVSMGQPARFSMLTPSGFPLLRAREQDTHLSLRQPLYAPGLLDGIEANRAAAEAAQLSSVAALRTQRRDITHAYLITQKARAASLIVAGSVNILQENLRINESLYANGKITQDAVLRARAELLSATQQRIEADQGRDQAQLRAAQSRRGPTVALGVDTGVQGENFGTGPRYNYLSGSLLLEWTIFDGGARSASIASARLAARQTDNLRQLAEQKIEMEARAALDAALAARESLAAAQARAAAASAAFRIASRKRDEGATTQIEFLDARNALTNSDLNLAWTRLDLVERRADLQFAAGSGTELLGAAP